jgi:acetyl-CoA C-acetyltransferase
VKEVIIASAVRTPVGNFGGSLRTIPAYDLAALVLNEVVKRANIAPNLVDEVIMAQNYQSGEYGFRNLDCYWFWLLGRKPFYGIND